MTTYDRLMHLLGAVCLGFLGLSANPGIYAHLPWWLIAAASVVGFAVQATTMPAVNRPVAIASSADANMAAARTTGTSTVTPLVGLFLVLALGLTSCTKNPPGAPPTPVGTFGNCTTDALRTASEGILAEVTTALATGDYVAELQRLAVTFGAAEVGCAVDLIIAEFRAKALRSDDTQVAVVLTHAEAWRLANP